MRLIDKYVEAMKKKDSVALAELFAADGSICDYCPNGTSQNEYHVYGKEAIDMFFRNRFLFNRYKISEAQVLNDNQAIFIASFDGFHVMALAKIRRVTSDGHIERLTVRPK